MKIVDFLDVTFNLTNGRYYPFKKPNNTRTYINTKSDHPPTIIKNLPASIGRRISDLPQNEEIFSKAKPYYQEALKSSGYNEEILHTNERKSTSRKRSRKRKIKWFNPPYSKNVQTNVAKIFLRLVNKHFPKKHKFHKIFNRNTAKVSYSCIENMASIIIKHHKRILNSTPQNQDAGCNCKRKDKCPLENNCLIQSVIYKASDKTEGIPDEKNYIGLREGTFKKRFYNHRLTFRNRNYYQSTKLSKHIWELKDKKKNLNTGWSIIITTAPYNNSSKKCNLCLTEKFCIVKADKATLVNKRSELMSRCRHENKYYIMNYKNEIT